MGLDIVEFILNVEETFDIRIPDRVAERIATPRMLITYLRSQLPPRTDSRPSCHTQRAFYTIRRAMGDRHDLRPGDTLPRDAWANVGRSINYRRWARLDASWGSWFRNMSLPATVGAGARELVARAPYSSRVRGEGWTDTEIEAIVRRLVVAHLPANEGFDLDDGFIEDMGAD